MNRKPVFVLTSIVLVSLIVTLVSAPAAVAVPAPGPENAGSPQAIRDPQAAAPLANEIKLFECWWYNTGCPPWILWPKELAISGEQKIADLAPAPYGFNDIASSIGFMGDHTGGRYVAVVYENVAYGGAWSAFGADDGQFDNDAINDDRASSVELRLVDCAGGQPGIYLYDDPNYAGLCRRHNFELFGSLDNAGKILFDDRAASVKLVSPYGPLLRMSLCQGQGMVGPCTYTCTDDPDLADNEVGRDALTSAGAWQWETNCGAGDGIYIYESSYYGNRCWKWTYDRPAFDQECFDNIASSIRFVGSYATGQYAAVLYEDVNYGGAKAVLLGDDPDLSDNGFDNRASSLRIITTVRRYLPTVVRMTP